MFPLRPIIWVFCQLAAISENFQAFFITNLKQPRDNDTIDTKAYCMKRNHNNLIKVKQFQSCLHQLCEWICAKISFIWFQRVDSSFFDVLVSLGYICLSLIGVIDSETCFFLNFGDRIVETFSFIQFLCQLHAFYSCVQVFLNCFLFPKNRIHQFVDIMHTQVTMKTSLICRVVESASNTTPFWRISFKQPKNWNNFDWLVV